MGATLEILQGDAIAPHLAELARLRITVFREYPYLYEGDEQSEQRYLNSFATHAHGALVVARDQGQVVGVASAMPLVDAGEAVLEPFWEAGLDPAEFFYFGESVLLRPWRGQGIGVRFMQAREQVARAHGSRYACFCGVERRADHPGRPRDYVPIDGFWRHRGYVPAGELLGRELVCVMDWPEIGSAEEISHRLRFWARVL